jgi:hypothetical protein
MVGCKAYPLAKKEEHKSKTEFTIPANSVFTFDNVTVTPSKPVSVIVEKVERKTTPPTLTDAAQASALEKFYLIGGILFVVACILFYRAHVKAGCFALIGAVCAPLLAKFYSSEAAQYVALASLCIAGALFVAWHLMKKKLETGNT